MDQFEKFDKQLISSYESTLAAEGKEICKEINSLIGVNDEFNIDKTEKYCSFCLNLRTNHFRKDLKNKCQKFKYDMDNFRSIKYELDSISEVRESQKKSLKK